jgi:hypothetical protein
MGLNDINANTNKLNSQINDKGSNLTNKSNDKTSKVNGKISDTTKKNTDKFNSGKSDVIGKKNKIFDKIAALRAIIEKNKPTNSMPSVNNKNKVLIFLTDLIKSLIGYAALIDVVINILTYSIGEIEEIIKSCLEEELRNIVSCGINPSIPSFLFTTGIDVEVSKIDFLDIFKVDPNSEYFDLIYNDVTSQLTNSTDFNTFLYGVIQDDGVKYTWDNMLDITFNSVGTGTRPNNSLTIIVNPTFSLKKLPDLNKSFIGKGKLLDMNKLINRIIDSLYGTMSVGLKKTIKQLETEAKVDEVIDRMIDTNNKQTIDDSFFTFSNEDIGRQQESAMWRKKGILKLECCNKVPASIPVSMLTDFNKEMSTATVLTKREIVANNINKMAEQNTINSENKSDDTSIKLNFIEQIITTLIKAIATSVISPKIVFIFLINIKIVYGQSKDYADAVDFIKISRNLFKSIIKKIIKRFSEELLKVVLKHVSELTSTAATKRLIEKAKDYQAQILSLNGVSPEAVRTIKGLS